MRLLWLKQGNHLEKEMYSQFYKRAKELGEERARIANEDEGKRNPRNLFQGHDAVLAHSKRFSETFSELFNFKDIPDDEEIQLLVSALIYYKIDASRISKLHQGRDYDDKPK